MFPSALWLARDCTPPSMMFAASQHLVDSQGAIWAVRNHRLAWFKT